MIFTCAPGATPIDPDEAAGLKPLHISLQNELNEWEANNILKAEKWAFSHRKHTELLSLHFICKLHEKMFGDTWRWAGTFRQTEKNISKTLANQIAPNLKNLVDDIQYQLDHRTYLVDEIAYRFHHRLVLIHPFPNGNGRHARLMTDLFLVQNGQQRFSWGSAQFQEANAVRTEYISALRCADKGDYSALAKFIRT